MHKVGLNLIQALRVVDTALQLPDTHKVQPQRQQNEYSDELVDFHEAGSRSASPLAVLSAHRVHETKRRRRLRAGACLLHGCKTVLRWRRYTAIFMRM
ncbi:hypothetical protein ALP29_201092 [Pseudomonas syringae pv. avii]|uniref:Uncharacterized protein n=1 Tax=Pseudomonas syringae pv. avii TaxID=663959 RepID=A0A3M5UCH9_PSESX|nr:hypothetical protein ALP29_201092 [Pseudomonas syringae pv. avii]